MQPETTWRRPPFDARSHWPLIAVTSVLALLATLKLGSADIPPPIPTAFDFAPVRSAAAEAALASPAAPRSSEGLGNLHIVHGRAPNDAERGAQLALSTLIFGGIPAALVAIGCASARGTTRSSWDTRWHTSFLLGLVFQAYNLALLVIPMLVAVVFEPLHSLTRTTFLVASVTGSVVALPLWRGLQLAAVSRPLLR